MPGYERYQRLSEAIPQAVKRGSLRVTWQEDGKAFEYERDGKKFRYDLARRQATELAPATNAVAAPPPAPTPERPERGRQYTTATSPDGQWRAVHRDRNVWLSRTNGDPVAITTDGAEPTRLKYGTANWVYGEELYQTTAMWWATNSQWLAFYRFDESAVRDYYLTLDHTQIQSRLDVEPYMKVGAPNPVVDLLVYDVTRGQTITVDVRDGQKFSDEVVGHYVYGVSWTADGTELLFHRTNRRQNILEFCAANPTTGRTRVIVREEWPASWTENLPPIRRLRDGRRFLWTSHRTGWRNLYLYDLTGALLSTVTSHAFDVADVKFVDESAGLVYYTAHSGDNPMKLQLHRVTLEGRDERCLTDRAYHHTVDLAPDGAHFVDVAQTHDTPPVTWLRDADGRFVAELARSDLTRAKALGLLPVELLRFKAADGATDLYGLLHFPSNFRPNRKYPLLVSVYAGPETTGARETFTLPDTLTELGFLVASFDSRGASGRGKQMLDAIYGKLGTVEIDDQAAGVRSLWPRRYVDRERVGIYGTSYGGTAAAACLLRHPQVFQAACANSAVTDFRNYDTIYTERYLGLLPESAAAYDAMSLLPLAPNLQGRLLIFFGTADNNVHPANSLQLIAALQKAGKSVEVQVGPDQGHTAVNRERMLEFFIENLVLNKPPRYRPPAEPAATGRSVHGRQEQTSAPNRPPR
jgi:dipeptidyl-peptidase-4